MLDFLPCILVQKQAISFSNINHLYYNNQISSFRYFNILTEQHLKGQTTKFRKKILFRYLTSMYKSIIKSYIFGDVSHLTLIHLSCAMHSMVYPTLSRKSWSYNVCILITGEINIGYRQLF